MKWLPLTAAALVIILAACIGVWCYLRDSAEQVCSTLSKVEESLWAEDWEAAESALSRVEAEWQELQPRWAVLIDHQEMEDVEVCLVDLKSSVRRRELQEALREAAELEYFLRHTPDAERPAWGNIF